MNDLALGVELLVTGLFTVFAILFIFKSIMDLMSFVVNRFHKKSSSDLTDMELAAVMAVMRHHIPPELSEAKIKFTIVKCKK